MAFGRRTRSLTQTVARTAVITGTAAATSNAVHGRAARKQATLAVNQPQPATPPAPVAESPVAVADIPGSPTDVIATLERLAALHASGALTDAEFAALKTQTIG